MIKHAAVWIVLELLSPDEAVAAMVANDGRRRAVAAEEWARFGSGREKWRAIWESRANMFYIRGRMMG